MNDSTSEIALLRLAKKGVETLQQCDPELVRLMEKESTRQNRVLSMVASSSTCDPSVLVCGGSSTINVTTEGYPGARYHAGCGVVDEIEELAISRAKKIFKARYANVQPHSGSSANNVLLFSLLQAGDTILGLDLDSGGHLTHGARASATGQYFNALSYGLDSNGFINYDHLLELALEHKPKVIICGASAYPRFIDFKKFREIADKVNAYVIADVSQISGLIVAGFHPSPIDHAHFTTTSTYKQLFGPRGGLILMGRDFDQIGPDGKNTLSQLVQRGVFPYFQGTPNLASIAAKARAFDYVAGDDFKKLGQRIIDNAKAISGYFLKNGYSVLTEGTDNHMVLLNVLQSKKMTGVVAEKALEDCNIIVNKNRILGDQKPPLVTSGIRIGSNNLAIRGISASQAAMCGQLIDRVLSSTKVIDDRTYELDANVISSVKQSVSNLCRDCPLPGYG